MSKLTKEEAQMYLDDLKVIICESNGCKKFITYFTYRDCKKCRSNRNFEGIQQLINEHFELLEKYKELKSDYDILDSTFDSMGDSLIECLKELDNPPLKYEELKEKMWVWDNKIKQYYQISCVFKDNREMATYGLMNGFVLFEQNRFYRKQVVE